MAGRGTEVAGVTRGVDSARDTEEGVAAHRAEGGVAARGVRVEVGATRGEAVAAHGTVVAGAARGAVRGVGAGMGTSGHSTNPELQEG